MVVIAEQKRRSVLPKTVQPWGAAVMLDSLDEPSIAKGLSGVISGPQRDDLARRAKPQASKFSWEKAAAQVERVFRKALEKRNPFNS